MKLTHQTPCPQCNGRGESSGAKYIGWNWTCPVCDGSGKALDALQRLLLGQIPNFYIRHTAEFFQSLQP